MNRFCYWPIWLLLSFSFATLTAAADSEESRSCGAPPCTPRVDAAVYEWSQKRDRDGIQIFTSKVEESPFKAVRGQMEVSGQVAELVALVNDLERCAEWAHLCRHSELIEQVSNEEKYVHVYNDVPFPVKDRDVVAQVRWLVDDVTGRVTMHSEALPQGQSEAMSPLLDSAVRIFDATTQWHFQQINEKTVRVENFAHIDPNGPTPAWITNMLLVSAPYKTMRNMRQIIEAGEYVGAELPF